MLESTFQYLKSKYISIHFVEHHGMFQINLDVNELHISCWSQIICTIYIPFEKTNGKIWQFPPLATVSIDKPFLTHKIIHRILSSIGHFLAFVWFIHPHMLLTTLPLLLMVMVRTQLTHFNCDMQSHMTGRWYCDTPL
jgi:hypothetical protein